MINFDNHDITAITYDDHSIQKVYGCDANLVWESQNPAASVNAYKTASGWSAYADRIQPMGQ